MFHTPCLGAGANVCFQSSTTDPGALNSTDLGLILDRWALLCPPPLVPRQNMGLKSMPISSDSR